MHALLLALLLSAPVDRVWIRTPPHLLGDTTPEVHSVDVTDDFVTVRSAGVSLGYLGPLQAAPQPRDSAGKFTFRLPRNPQPATNRYTHVPSDITGVFVNGLPIYNQFEAISYQGQNLWHFDAVALRQRGESSPGLLEALIPGTGQPSPIIGYALDGYPIYGPWGFNSTGGLRRMRASYRLRSIAERTRWADGTELAPGQYGPPVTREFPLGTFVEDYEYAEGHGDLDRYNGRFARTPEYPDGTYAYFLASDEASRLAFPYLLAHEYYGVVEAAEPPPLSSIGSRSGVTLRAGTLSVGQPTTLRLQMPARFLEYVHEKPIHMMIVSADLSGFDHIHPELTPAGDWEVDYTFARGGKHRVYLEFTPPGEGPQTEFFDVNVSGQPAAPASSPPPAIDVTLKAGTIRAGQDTELNFALNRNSTLEPYLGAWAHFAIVGDRFSSFIHAHPLGDAPEPLVHNHGAVTGPPPSELRTVVSFPKPGLYKLWAQFQVAGRVETVPFVLHVGEALAKIPPVLAAPKDAIHIQITTSGYEPARIEAPSGKPVKLWFTRTGEPNCGAKVLFPSLGIAREIPLGGSALVEIAAPPSGEIKFTCGMGMYRGMIVVR